MFIFFKVNTDYTFYRKYLNLISDWQSLLSYLTSQSSQLLDKVLVAKHQTYLNAFSSHPPEVSKGLASKGCTYLIVVFMKWLVLNEREIQEVLRNKGLTGSDK